MRLYVETESSATYVREENESFDKLFIPLNENNPNAKVILNAGEYNSLRDFCNLQTDTLLNHTMLFQVDEFWAASRDALGQIARFPRGPISRREGALYHLAACGGTPRNLVRALREG